MEPQDPHPHITIFYAVWAAVGPLTGLVVGAALQARGQHKQWRRDNVRQECRELLGQLSVTLFAFIDWHRALTFEARVGEPDDAAILASQRYDAAVLDLHRNLASRLLIAKGIKNAHIALRWKAAREDYMVDGDAAKLDAIYEGMVADIVEIGLKE